MLLGEQSPNGDWQWYIRDPDTDEPLLTLIDGVPYFYELDHRMMPVRLWDAEGKRVWQANADAWGRCQPETPEGPIHQPIRLPGQFEDELSGLYNNRFRDYDPSTGRYLMPDPLGLKGGLNSYRYTPNPVDYVDPLGLNTCSARGPGPEEAEYGEMAPVTEDSPALQNLEVAGAAALARAPAPAPAPASPGVTRVAVSTAANDAVYASQRSWLGRALPVASTAAAFVTGMAYSSSLGGGLQEITAPDGTVYRKHGDERVWNATGPGDAQWQTVFPQEDMEYRTWLANGGDGSFEEWVANGKPKDVLAGGVPVPNSASAFSKVAPATAKQLQKKLKHAEDFGVSGSYNPANAKKFNEAIQNHLNSPGVKEISGNYRGNPVTFHTNPNTGLTVIQNPNGSFLSGWKLNPQQLQHVFKDGKL